MVDSHTLLSSLEDRVILITEILNMNRYLRTLIAENSAHNWKDIGRAEVIIDQLYRHLDILTQNGLEPYEKSTDSVTV
jgi:hypothetical protein